MMARAAHAAARVAGLSAVKGIVDSSESQVGMKILHTLAAHDRPLANRLGRRPLEFEIFCTRSEQHAYPGGAPWIRSCSLWPWSARCPNWWNACCGGPTAWRAARVAAWTIWGPA